MATRSQPVYFSQHLLASLVIHCLPLYNTMVLTDRQRDDLHAGIYEYLCSQPGFEKVAAALQEAAPNACERHGDLKSGGNNVNGHTPILEKKWTLIPRLQKKVLELEKQAAQSAKIHAHRAGGAGAESDAAAGGATTRRMLPRLPAAHTLAGHSMVVTCCAVHPVFTVAVSGSEDGTIKVSELLVSCCCCCCCWMEIAVELK